MKNYKIHVLIIQVFRILNVLVINEKIEHNLLFE